MYVYTCVVVQVAAVAAQDMYQPTYYAPQNLSTAPNLQVKNMIINIILYEKVKHFPVKRHFKDTLQKMYALIIKIIKPCEDTHIYINIVHHSKSNATQLYSNYITLFMGLYSSC